MDTVARLLDAADATLARRVATTGVLYALSDVLAQSIVPPPKAGAAASSHAGTAPRTARSCRSRWDAARTLRLALYGALVFAPLQSLWLGTVIERVPYGTVAKVALDQLTMSPFGLFLFLVYTTALGPLPAPAASITSASASKSRSTSARDNLQVHARIHAARRKVRLEFFPTLRRSWAVWVPVQVLTIGLVPPRERLLFVNVVALFWNAFLSFVSVRQAQHDDQPAVLPLTRVTRA